MTRDSRIRRSKFMNDQGKNSFSPHFLALRKRRESTVFDRQKKDLKLERIEHTVHFLLMTFFDRCYFPNICRVPTRHSHTSSFCRSTVNSCYLYRQIRLASLAFQFRNYKINLSTRLSKYSNAKITVVKIGIFSKSLFTIFVS